ncbi:hypothetical protein K5V07_10050 [Flavobacterium sp. CHNK8]|jgi:hypothetical protein|uniref:hypothetical protein n=1 Tax=Flavobacterium sp. CHNK8 TaxID=2871165 RepID=UPI001C8EA42D|nr:hypothetical protein [Flavobacterium sp. CHNK8]QZK90814.1 hypothetical protein K5V07_10050 [Flavobacterium sp. CHNK8]
MRKLKNTNSLTTCKRIITGIKKRIIVILTAIMLGFAMGFHENESILHKNSKQTEWQNKKE